MSRRVAVGSIAVVALAGAITGCGGGAGQAGQAFRDTHPLPVDTMTVAIAEIGHYGGRFVLSQTIGPKTFNAMMGNETSTTDVTDKLFGALAEFNNATQLEVPTLAKSWEVSADGLTYTWHLRRGAAFSDGHPLSADDVLFSFEVAYNDSLHPAVQDLLKVGGKPFEVSKLDSFTVVTKLPAPYALIVPAVGSLRIMPKHVLEPAYRHGEFASSYTVSIAPESLVTSGPWRLKQYVPGEKTVLTRNPYWFGVDPAGHRLPYLDEVVFLIVPDQDAADLKFRAGESDGIDNVKPENYKWYQDNEKSGNYTLYDVGPSLNTNFFWFNLNRVRDAKSGKRLGAPFVDPVKYAWFSNPVFRRAVSMAIDRDAIIQSAFYGAAIKNFSNTTAGNKIWHNENLPRFDYDLEGAKRLLASLGWKDRDGDGYLEDGGGHTIQFSLKTNGDNKIRTAMCNFVQADLQKVGIKCDPTPVDFNTLITNSRQDFQYESIMLGLQSGVPPDPAMGQNVYRSSGLTHYWNVKQPRPETPEEAEIDRLISANVVSADMGLRHQTWDRIQTIMNEQCWFVWLPTQIQKMPVRNRFGNIHPSVIPHRLLWNIEEVFVKPGSPRV